MLGHNLAFSTPTSGSGTSGNINNNLISLIAGEALGYPRAVMTVAGKVMLFNPATSIAGSVVGLTTASAVLNAVTPILTQGKLTYTGWGLTQGSRYYAGNAGVVSLTPVASGNMQPIGVALTPDTLLLNITNPVDIV